MGSALGWTLFVFSRKFHSSTRGFTLLWGVAAFVPLTSALDSRQSEPQSSTSALDDKVIVRHMVEVSVTTEAALKSALIHGNTVVITQNITLSNVIIINSGTITVSATWLT